MRDGVAASRLQLPPGPWVTVFEALCARFPRVHANTWRERFARGLVLDAEGRALDVSAACRPGDEIYYFREVPDEAPVAATSRAVAVSRPERCICQVIWSSTQPEYIA